MLPDKRVPEGTVLLHGEVRRRLSRRLPGERQIVRGARVLVMSDQMTRASRSEGEVVDINIGSRQFERLVICPVAPLPEPAADVLIVRVVHRRRDVTVRDAACPPGQRRCAALRWYEEAQGEATEDGSARGSMPAISRSFSRCATHRIVLPDDFLPSAIEGPEESATVSHKGVHDCHFVRSERGEQ